MRTTTTALLVLLLLSTSASAQEPVAEAWRAVLVAEPGPRLDYMTSTCEVDVHDRGQIDLCPR